MSGLWAIGQYFDFCGNINWWKIFDGQYGRFSLLNEKIDKPSVTSYFLSWTGMFGHSAGDRADGDGGKRGNL